jgi:hypothetical protein
MPYKRMQLDKVPTTRATLGSEKGTGCVKTTQLILVIL